MTKFAARMIQKNVLWLVALGLTLAFVLWALTTRDDFDQDALQRSSEHNRAHLEYSARETTINLSLMEAALKLSTLGEPSALESLTRNGVLDGFMVVDGATSKVVAGSPGGAIADLAGRPETALSLVGGPGGKRSLLLKFHRPQTGLYAVAISDFSRELASMSGVDGPFALAVEVGSDFTCASPLDINCSQIPREVTSGALAPYTPVGVNGQNWGFAPCEKVECLGRVITLTLGHPLHPVRAEQSLARYLNSHASFFAALGFVFSFAVWILNKAVVDRSRFFKAEREAQHRIRTGEARFGAIFDGVGEAIYLVAQDGTVKLHNRSTQTQLGYGEGSLVGRNFEELVPEDEKESWKKIWQAVVGGADTGYLEKRLALDGRLVPVEGSATSIQLGQKRGYLLVERDVTEKEKLESQRRALDVVLRRAQTLEAISTLAGGVAHEFNNQLAVIMGFSEIALDDVKDNDDLSESLRKILTASQGAAELVDQLTKFSRKTTKEHMPLNLRVLLKESVKNLKATAPANVKVKDNIASQTGYVNADPGELNSVLNELYQNAREAIGEKEGAISIVMEDVEIGEIDSKDGLNLPAGNYVSLQISDNGRGMSQTDLQHLFNPFYSTKSLDGGIGMGLAVVHGIIKAHEGEILVDSREGVGTVFTILLPVCRSDYQS